jgi:hypothetical protein
MTQGRNEGFQMVQEKVEVLQMPQKNAEKDAE